MASPRLSYSRRICANELALGEIGLMPLYVLAGDIRPKSQGPVHSCFISNYVLDERSLDKKLE